MDERQRRLDDLRQCGRITWIGDERGWIGRPEEIVDALACDGYQEYKREETRGGRRRAATGGVWQGLNVENGSVASAIWVNRAAGDAAIVFIDIDGTPLTGPERSDA